MLAFSLLAAPVAAQSVIVVDSSGGGDFLDLPQAVAAAAPADTVLVLGGGALYTGPVINKSLRLVFDPATNPGMSGPIIVQGIDPDEDVQISGPTSPSAAGLTIRQCAGTVWVQRYSAIAELGQAPPILVEDSSSVILSSCGSRADSDAGLVAIRSTVHAFGCQFSSSGQFAQFSSPAFPGAAIHNSLLFSYGCSFFGGSSFFAGAAGISVQSSSTVTDRASTFSGGSSANPGTQGSPISVGVNSTFTVIGGPYHRLFVDPSQMRIPREGDIVAYGFDGPPGDLIALNVAITPPAPLYLDVVNGSLLVGGNPFSVFLGAIPPVGGLTFTSPVTELGAGVDSRLLYLQVIALDPVAPAIYSGEPFWLTQLDSAF